MRTIEETRAMVSELLMERLDFPTFKERWGLISEGRASNVWGLPILQGVPTSGHRSA